MLNMSLYIKEIRGVVNSEISNEFTSNLGNVIGNFLTPGKEIVVGRDSNKQSQMIKRSITAGILAAGINVIDFGVAPIPSVHHGAKNIYNIDIIVTVSASHLHADEVAIKIFSDYEIPLERHAERVSWDKIGQTFYTPNHMVDYIDSALKHIEGDIIKNLAPKIVVDCANGSTVPFLPKILGDLGCETILLGCQYAGTSPSKFADPTPESVSLVSNLVKAVSADMGIALDNDGDRIVFTDENGKIIKDQTVLGIFAREALLENPEGTVVSSVVTSMSMDDVVSKYGGKVIKTPVDLVLKGIIENNAIFGGDEPGMYVFPEFQDCFDAIFAAVKMLETMCRYNKPLSKLAEELPEYPRAMFSVKCEHERKMKTIKDLREELGKMGILNSVDGVRVDMNDSFILIRPSRFEPLLRVYIEAKSPEKLQKLENMVKEMLSDP